VRSARTQDASMMICYCILFSFFFCEIRLVGQTRVKTVLCKLGDSRNSPSLTFHGLWLLPFVNSCSCSSSSSSANEDVCLGRSGSLSDI